MSEAGALTAYESEIKLRGPGRPRKKPDRILTAFLAREVVELRKALVELRGSSPLAQLVLDGSAFRLDQAGIFLGELYDGAMPSESD